MKLINDIILWSIWLGAMFLAFIVFIAKNEYLWAGVAIVPIMIAYADIIKTKKTNKRKDEKIMQNIKTKGTLKLRKGELYLLIDDRIVFLEDILNSYINKDIELTVKIAKNKK